ncbi:MAG: GntP family permease [Fidelibacterota bacterium]|nr:MAG: GntP family permease [Candidatus Neomarinimicrobiota bacterium]
MEGFALIAVLIGAIVCIILLISLLKVHPFLALIVASLGVGLVVGMPLQDILLSITNGFGGLMGYIGLVIVFGTIIGTILEKSGGALKMADIILRIVGYSRPAAAMSIIGAIVSIPVFCDSGFVILSRLNRALAAKAKVPPVTMAVALGTGLYATHTLVPPTPGPIAAAGNLGASEYLGTVIWIGLLTSIPVLMVGYWWARRIGRAVMFEAQDTPVSEPPGQLDTASLPPAGRSFAPIVLPILLIAAGSIVRFYGWAGTVADILLFIGHPLTALFLGVCASFLLMPRFDEEHLTRWVGKGIRQAGPILLITGAGGAFGSVLKATPLTDLIGSLATQSGLSGSILIVIAFLIAAGLKSSQGSSTAALVITSSLLAPVLPVLGLHTPAALALVVMAIGSGAMTVSHVNDSYFWVVSQFSDLTVAQAYRSFTFATLFQGVTGLVTTLLLYQILA